MDGNNLIKEIKAKGNGQAVIYISKIDLKHNGFKFGDFLELTKVSHEKYVDNLEDNKK